LATQRRFEGNTLAEVLAKVQKEVGADAKIASAQKVRSGGAFGFFQRERFEVLVDLPDPAAVAAAAAAKAAAAPVAIPAPPDNGPDPDPVASLIELANKMSQHDTSAEELLGAGSTARSAAPAPQPGHPTEDEVFAEVLSRMAFQDQPDSADEGSMPATDEVEEDDVYVDDEPEDEGQYEVEDDEEIEDDVPVSFQTEAATEADADTLPPEADAEFSDDTEPELVVEEPLGPGSAAEGLVRDDIAPLGSAAESLVRDDEIVEPEPEPLVVEPEPEPVFIEPEPEPEPVFVEPEPEPEPVALEAEPEPEPIAVEPEPDPEPQPVAIEPEPVPTIPERPTFLDIPAPMPLPVAKAQLSGRLPSLPVHEELQYRHPDSTPLRTRITDHPLSALGLPASYIPEKAMADVTGVVDLREALLSTLEERLPRVPVIRPSRGSVIAVVGPHAEAMQVARDLAREHGRPVDEVTLASQRVKPEKANSKDPVLRTIENAEDAQRSWSRRKRVTIVAIDAPLGSHDTAWAEHVLTALEPIATFGVADATRKAEDIQAWIDGLGGIDCIALNRVEETVSPASVLSTGVPVERIDGRKASPEFWALLLTERLTAA
jgi:hypothetical protein